MGRPSGPVCLVTSRWPSMSAVAARTVSRSRASLTPPALPRPPACTWALTTHRLPPSDCAARDRFFRALAGRRCPRGREFRIRGTLLSTGTRGGSSGSGGGGEKRGGILAGNSSSPAGPADTVAPDAASRRRPARTDRSRLARHRAGESLPAADSAGALSAVAVLRRGHADWQRVTRSCSSGPAWSISPPASPLSSAAGACCPTCGQPPSFTRWSTRWPSACCCSPAAASPAASASCSWCPWARWPCWPTAAMHSCWRRWPPWRCSRSRSAAHVTGHAPDVRLSSAPASSAASCSWWRCWPGRWRSRLRDTEATVRRQQVDLANLAQLSQYIVQNLRESIVVVDHENRIRLINESAAQMLGDRGAYPGALLGEASPQLLYLLETWRQRTTDARGARADLRRRRRRPRDPAAFRAARRRGTLAGHRVPRGHRTAGRQDPAVEARRARPAVREHRARDPQSRRRHEPRGATARRVRRRCRPRTSG